MKTAIGRTYAILPQNHSRCSWCSCSSSSSPRHCGKTFLCSENNKIRSHSFIEGRNCRCYIIPWNVQLSFRLVLLSYNSNRSRFEVEPVAHLAWKKGSVAKEQLLISLFSIKHIFSWSRVHHWILWCCQSTISAKFCRYMFIQTLR